MRRTHRTLPIGGLTVAAAALGLAAVTINVGENVVAQAADTPSVAEGENVAPGLVLPPMDPIRGKKLFAGKGCVVCHSINKVGGSDAPALDASTMPPAMNPFDFTAKMWLGALPMITMQQRELGRQIEFTGQDLADIIAFVHNAKVQSSFTAADIPAEIKKLMEGDEKKRR